MSEPKTEVFGIATTAADCGEAPEENRKIKSKKVCSVYEQYVQPCLAELFGTSLFVFVGCASVVENQGLDGAIQPAVAHGLALGIVIAVLGQISGGHFNPAVSLSAYLCGGMKLPLLFPYILVQLCGAMIGAGLVKAIYPSLIYTTALGGAFTTLKNGNNLGGATVAETVMSLFLTSVVCMGAVNSRTSSILAPFCIGLTVTACILAGGSVSGACMNPARAFGPAVAAGYWDQQWVYWVGPTCGALLTAFFIRLMLGDQKTRVVLK